MTRKKRTRAIPCFVFTPETIRIAQNALTCFEQGLQRGVSASAKVAFARETLQEVNRKLAAMQASVGMLSLTTFDANEKIVLAAAIQLYTLDLLAEPVSARRERALKHCRRLAQFAQDALACDDDGPDTGSIEDTQC